MSDPKTLPSELLRQAFDGSFAQPATERRQDSEPYLALRVSSTAYAIAVQQIGGFAPARKIVPIGSALPALLGVTAVRGRLYPVYSIEALLAETATSEGAAMARVLCGGAEPVALSFAVARLPRGTCWCPSAARFGRR